MTRKILFSIIQKHYCCIGGFDKEGLGKSHKAHQTTKKINFK